MNRSIKLVLGYGGLKMKLKLITITFMLLLAVTPVGAKKRHAKRLTKSNVYTRHLAFFAPMTIENYCREYGATLEACKYHPPCKDNTDKQSNPGPTRPINIDCKHAN